MPDVAVAKNGDVFIADGEGANTRIVKFSKDGTVHQVVGAAKAPIPASSTCRTASPSIRTIASTSPIARTTASRFSTPNGKFLDQWTTFGTPWGLFIKGDLIYVVDGTANNCLLIASIKDGKVLDRIDGLSNPTAVTVDSTGAIYVGEVNGMNVKKFVKN